MSSYLSPAAGIPGPSPAVSEAPSGANDSEYIASEVQRTLDEMNAQILAELSSATSTGSLRDRITTDVSSMKRSLSFNGPFLVRGIKKETAAQHTCFRYEDFDAIDTNRSGKISKDEWLAAGLDVNLFYAIGGRAKLSLSMPAKKQTITRVEWNNYVSMQPPPAQVFESADTDGDHKLSSGEAVSFGFGLNFFKYLSSLVSKDDKIAVDEWDKYFNVDRNPGPLPKQP